MGGNTLEVLAPFFLFLIIFLLISPTCVSKEDDCIHLTTCGHHLPPPLPTFLPPPPNPLPIQFPFSLKNQQQEKCSYPGYGLSCTKKNETVLELPFSGKFFVRSINYTAQEMEIYDPYGCLPGRLLDFNLSDTPFKGKFTDYDSNYTYFNCSNYSTVSTDDSHRIYSHTIHCLTKPNSTYSIRRTYAYSSLWSLVYFPLEFCHKMRTVSIPDGEYANYSTLIWDKPPGCRKCESHGGQCRFNSNHTGGLDDIECFGAHYKGAWRKNTAICVIIGFLVFLIATLMIIRTCTQPDKDEIEKQLKIEKFLESYKDLTPTRYSYADIKRITNKFQRQLGEGGFGSVYEGKLTDGIPVAVKILNDSQSSGEDFINEVGTIGRIHHINVVNTTQPFRVISIFNHFYNYSRKTTTTGRISSYPRGARVRNEFNFKCVQTSYVFKS